MEYSARDKVKVIGYNPANSEELMKTLTRDFPIGKEYQINKIERKGLKKTIKDKIAGKIECKEEEREYCKKSSDSQCLSIKNDKGEITHICYLEIEKV